MFEEFLPQIRSKFPRVDKDFQGRNRVFLDSGAGSMVLEDAVRAEAQARVDFAAEHDAPAEESSEAGKVIYRGRMAVADILNAESPELIVSGESTTSLLFNLGYAHLRTLKPGGNIVTTEYEHYANVSPWLELKERGFVDEVRFARFNPETYELDVNHLASLVDSHTRVVSVTGASNLLGTITPLQMVGKIAREHGAVFVVDGVHLMPHYPVDVQAIGCDFFVFSAYKLFCRFGSFMYGRREALEGLKPYKVEPAPESLPWRWEHGNRDPALFAAVAAVADYYEWLGGRVGVEPRGFSGSGRRLSIKAAQTAIREYESRLSRRVLEGLGGLEGRVKLYGPPDASRVEVRVPTFSFTLKGFENRRVVEALWRDHRIFVREENFYSRAVKSLGVPGVIRASFAHYNTPLEADRLLDALGRLMQP
ncbi:MAG: aminotransferase class V-fold PLP-dependent enzyme [Thermoprotei archaeon]